MTAQIGARRTLKLTPEGFRGTKRPHPPHGRVRRRSPSRRRLRARRAPSGGLGASRAPRPRSQNQCATVAALESAAKEPLHLPFQPRGAHAALRAFLGTSAKSGRRAAAKKKGVHGVDLFKTRPNPGAGSEAHDDKSSPPAGRLARRRAARRKCVAEQNCDFAAAPVRGVQNFNVAASHIAREVTPLRISPEGRVVARLARG